jgi:hypothetical protein
MFNASMAPLHLCLNTFKAVCLLGVAPVVGVIYFRTYPDRDIAHRVLICSVEFSFVSLT